MKKILTLAFVAILTVSMSGLYAQKPAQPKGDAPQHQCDHKEVKDAHQHNGAHCGNCPHHQAPKAEPTVNADGIAMEIVRAFPAVKSVNKTAKWTEVYNAKKELLGYAVYSKPASNGIKGYAGETPLLIALDTHKKVTSVELLKNVESKGYVQKVQKAGLFDQWNGLTIKKARKKKVDTVSGATYTSKSVIESFQAALKNL